MKNKFLSMGLCAFMMMGCSEENENGTVNTQPVVSENPEIPSNPDGGDNKVLMLKVDLLTHAFEGGKVFTFEAADTFTIAAEYMAPADFGSIKLKYNELDAAFFDGEIHWMGLGQMTYPENLDPATSFAVLDYAVEMPEISAFHTVEYIEGNEGEGIVAPDHQSIWYSINHLQLVKDFRESNPQAKVQLFLYTPSVGIGDPAEWDWFVILKN
mgnify:CR=1 FL=1